MINTLISTEDFAKLNHVKACTVHRSHCLNGHYHQVIPFKGPSGRLMWPPVIATGEPFDARDFFNKKAGLGMILKGEQLLEGFAEER